MEIWDKRYTRWSLRIPEQQSGVFHGGWMKKILFVLVLAHIAYADYGMTEMAEKYFPKSNQAKPAEMRPNKPYRYSPPKRYEDMSHLCLYNRIDASRAKFALSVTDCGFFEGYYDVAKKEFKDIEAAYEVYNWHWIIDECSSKAARDDWGKPIENKECLDKGFEERKKFCEGYAQRVFNSFKSAAIYNRCEEIDPDAY